MRHVDGVKMFRIWILVIWVLDIIHIRKFIRTLEKGGKTLDGFYDVPRTYERLTYFLCIQRGPSCVIYVFGIKALLISVSLNHNQFGLPRNDTKSGVIVWSGRDHFEMWRNQRSRYIIRWFSCIYRLWGSYRHLNVPPNHFCRGEVFLVLLVQVRGRDSELSKIGKGLHSVFCSFKFLDP